MNPTFCFCPGNSTLIEIVTQVDAALCPPVLLYCDSRSECYQVEDFDGEVLVKANAIDLLRKELASKRVKGTIGTGSMNDPYMPLERSLNLTGRALEVIVQFRFPVHILTKSDLVLKDLDTLREINRLFAAVSFTITTADDALGKKLKPGAPLVSKRFKAIQTLAALRAECWKFEYNPVTLSKQEE